MSRWTFLSNHGHVIVSLARDPDLRLQDIAAAVGISERAARAIVNDLEDEGYVTKERIGRRNHYRLDPERPLRHPLEEHKAVGDLLSLIVGDDEAIG